MKGINIRVYYICMLLILPCGILISCNRQSANEEAKEEIVQTYTCPMHPQIVSNKPSTCPVCGMDLVLFDKNNRDEFLTLGPEQILLANIKTTEVGGHSLDATRILNGRIVENESSKVMVSSRAGGRIEVLMVKEEGIRVKKGQPLMKIYSEELAALQEELKIAHAQYKAFPENERFKNIYEAAVHKLKLFGLTPSQIHTMETGSEDSPLVTIYSPASGIVTRLNVKEGNYVNTGEAIMQVEDLSELWVEIEVYPNELDLVKKGTEVIAFFPATGKESFSLKVDFTSPELIPGTQLTKIRASLKNPRELLQPGSQAIIYLKSAQNSSETLVIPLNAVIQEEKGAHVWVETEEGKFEPRAIKPGIQGKEQIEVLDGLDRGEKLVVSGAYLLYSEYILKRGKHPIYE